MATGSTAVWADWIGTSTTTGYTSTSITAWDGWMGTGTSTWEYWVEGATTATNNTITVTTDEAWDMWVTNGNIFTDNRRTTPEVIATRERENKARMEMERTRKTKARRLLMAALHAQQQDDMNKHNYFYVIGGKTGHKYRIDHGRAA